MAVTETTSAQQRWRTLRIENTVNRRNVVDVWVTGDVRRGDETEDVDSADDGRIRSVLTDRSAADTFEFTGRIRRIRWSEAEPRAFVDGDRIDPEEYRDDDDDDWQVMRVFNTVDRRNVVDIRVTGDVRKGDEAEREDVARRGFARSVLSDRSAVDSFEFTGRITDVSWSERRPRIAVDGRTVDLDRFDDDDDDRDLPSYLRVTGPRSGSVRVYVRVTGRIDALAGDEGDSSPRVADVRVGGQSYPRVREFRYSGRIFQLATAEGDVAIDIQQRDD